MTHSFRDEKGVSRSKTIANLSKLPPYALSALDMALKGGEETSIFTGKDISYETSIPIGHVWALYRIASDIGMIKLLDCIGKERKAMVLSMIFVRYRRLRTQSSFGHAAQQASIIRYRRLRTVILFLKAVLHGFCSA